MGYVQIRIKQVGSADDFKRWVNHMLEKPKCWNKFCLGLCCENEIRAVHVFKEGKDDNVFLTTLCEDCIKETADYGILVNESHLIVETK